MYSPNHAAARGPRPADEPGQADSVFVARALLWTRKSALDTGLREIKYLPQNQIAV
jgi:hypothetical protein